MSSEQPHRHELRQSGARVTLQIVETCMHNDHPKSDEYQDKRCDFLIANVETNLGHNDICERHYKIPSSSSYLLCKNFHFRLHLFRGWHNCSRANLVTQTRKLITQPPMPRWPLMWFSFEHYHNHWYSYLFCLFDITGRQRKWSHVMTKQQHIIVLLYSECCSLIEISTFCTWKSICKCNKVQIRADSLNWSVWWTPGGSDSMLTYTGMFWVTSLAHDVYPEVCIVQPSEPLS